SPQRVTEQQLRAGVGLVAVAGLEPPAGVAAVTLDRPGVFRVGGGVRACSLPDAPCNEPANGVVAAAGPVLWLVRDLATRAAKRAVKASRAVPAPGAPRPPPGERAGELAGLAARSYDLPRGAKRLRLALGEGTVATLSWGDFVDSVLWFGGEPFEETLDTGADRLTILHTREARDGFHFEILPLGRGEMTDPLEPGTPYERADLRPGMVRLEVAPPGDWEPPPVVHVRGAGVEAVLIGYDRRIARGTDLPLGHGGRLLVRHGPGFVLAWVDRKGEAAADLF